MRRAATASSSLLRRPFRPRRPLHDVARPGNSTTRVTTLPNKIRVATEATPGHFSAVGLYVDSGSRYEDPSTSGVSHFIDRMAFKTTSTRSSSEWTSDLDKLGGQILCSSSRETVMYQSSHFRKDTPLAMSLIADTATNVAFIPEELDGQREAARYEIREVSAKPEMILPEIMHEVAFGGKSLGNPLLCPEDRIDKINGDMMRGYIKQWYRPERMVIAGAGMPHEELVELADKYFSSLKYTPIQQPSPSSHARATPTPSQFISTPPPTTPLTLTRAASYLFPNALPSDCTIPGQLHSQSAYTGGHKFIQDPNADFNHVYLAYEGVGIHDDDIYALATMQVLLGGGGSFSAGGPGKGMYSRLYTHILNYNPQIDHCASFHHIYADTSLFGLFATFVPAQLQGGNTPGQIMPHLAHQLSLLLYTPIPHVELSRAKNQLKSSLMMALESRVIEVEDLGRQVLVHGRKIPVEEMCDMIDKVDQEDIRRVAARLFGPDVRKKATVVVKAREDVGDWQKVLRTYGIGGSA